MRWLRNGDQSNGCNSYPSSFPEGRSCEFNPSVRWSVLDSRNRWEDECSLRVKITESVVKTIIRYLSCRRCSENWSIRCPRQDNWAQPFDCSWREAWSSPSIQSMLLGILVCDRQQWPIPALHDQRQSTLLALGNNSWRRHGWASRAPALPTIVCVRPKEFENFCSNYFRYTSTWDIVFAKLFPLTVVRTYSSLCQAECFRAFN